jgi:hypothetical protein
MIDEQTVNDRWTGWQEKRRRSRNESEHAKQSRWKEVICYVCPDSADPFSVLGVNAPCLVVSKNSSGGGR